MPRERSIPRYRRWYARLLLLYPKTYYERFGEGMAQTFNDLLEERAQAGRDLFGFVLWILLETSAGILRESVVMQRKSILRLALATTGILLVPLLAMLFTEQVNWSLGDFIIAGVLIFGTGLAYLFVVRSSGTRAYRVAAGIGLVTALALVWINAAVGVIGNENNPANLMFFGVLAVGFVGALIARFRPRGMALALVGAAVAQTLVALIVLIARLGTTDPSWPQDIVMMTAIFCGLWLLSAWLFHKASTDTEQAPTHP